MKRALEMATNLYIERHKRHTAKWHCGLRCWSLGEYHNRYRRRATLWQTLRCVNIWDSDAIVQNVHKMLPVCVHVGWDLQIVA